MAAASDGVSSNSNPSGVQGVCPGGWYLPSDAEWQQLVDFVESDGHSGTEGTALKSTNGWNSGGNGTDNYGFNGLPSGARSYQDGLFGNFGENCFLWNTSIYNSTNAFYANLSNINIYVILTDNDKKSYGFSVRCIKDN